MPPKVNAGWPVRVPFEPVQALETTRRRSMTPEEREPGAHGGVILTQSRRDGASLVHTRVRHCCDPGIELVAATLTEHAAAGVGVVIRAGHHRVKAKAMGEEGVIARALVFRVRQQQACRSKSGYWGRTALVLIRGLERRRRHVSKFPPGARLPPSLADVPLHRHP